MDEITIMNKHFGENEAIKKELFQKYEKILNDTLKVLRKKSKKESEEYIVELLKAALDDGFSYGFHDAYTLLKDKK